MGHVEEAERLAHRGLDGDYVEPELRDRLIANAQVEATLAVVDALERILDVLESRLSSAGGRRTPL